MSSSTALALIIAASFPAFFALYLAKMAVDTGVVGGVPVSINYRWLLLFQTWVSWSVSAVGMAILPGVVALNVAGNVADTGIRLVAYFGAFISALLAAGILLSGAVEFLHFRSILRESTPR